MRPLHFLIVDDDVDKRLLMTLAIGRRFPTASIFECYSGKEALEYFKKSEVDLIITNHNMRPVNGLELVTTLRASAARVPIIMVSGHDDMREPAEKAGVDLFLSSDNLLNLGEPVAAFLRHKGILQENGPLGVAN